MRNLKVVWKLAVGLSLTTNALAQEGESSTSVNELSVGAYYATGDYGQEADTSIYYFPFAYERHIGNWNLQLSVPHLEISGAGDVLVNVGGVGRNDLEPLDELEPIAHNQKGLGDTVLSATYQIPSFSSTLPFFDLGFEVKLPTADENKGLGTGAYDYGVQLDAYQQVGASTLFATVGYKLRGKSTLFDRMQDSLFLSLGVSRPLSERWSYGVIYDFREAASAGSGETHELLPFVSFALANEWTLMSYAVKGFTQDSADIAIGTQLSYRW